MTNRKVYIVGNEDGFKDFFEEYGFQVTKDVFEADLLQFTGGEDVTPEIYGEANTQSYNNTDRDLIEMGFYALALRLNKPMVGVCRGGQFLNVMCGGKMIQNVHGHTKNHEIITKDGEVLMATSTHHQMMIPDEFHGEVWAWANIVHKTADPYHPGFEEYDSEVIFYDDQRCLCFQPHPEYRRYERLEKYYFELIDQLLLWR